MNYKEKYEKALATARKLYNEAKTNEYTSDMEDYETIFPELKESEDERIRKELIRQFDGIKESYPSWGGLITKDIIAYLERQGETFTKKDVDDAYLKGICDAKQELERQGEQKPIIEMKTPEESLDVDSDTYNKIVDECIYGEQKPDDKVEPKFRQGDYLVNIECGNVVRILEVLEDNYRLDYGGDTIGTLSTELVDRDYRLWNITKDAKDGDVLYINNTMSESIMIYKSFNNGVINKYASYNKFGFEGENYLTLNDGYITPATKEQRDILMNAMKEAGYTFDFEKKELMKIEQNPAWSEEDELRMENILSVIEGYGYPMEVKWLKSLKDRVQPKQEWSDKDKMILDNINLYVTKAAKDPHFDKGYIEEAKNWLKSIKDRIQPQPKQEWNEKDEIALADTLWCCKQAASIAKDENDMGNIWFAENWLKSLRPHSQWKPTEEQLEALHDSFQGGIDYTKKGMILAALYEQLKKLRDK